MGRLDLPDPPRDEDRWPQRLGGRALTAVEIDVLVGAARGERQLDTARRRGTALDTVKSQRRSIIAKLGARSTANAIAIATEAGIIAGARPVGLSLAEVSPNAFNAAAFAMARVSRALAMRDYRDAFATLRPICGDRVAIAFLVEQGLPAER